MSAPAGAGNDAPPGAGSAIDARLGPVAVIGHEGAREALRAATSRTILLAGPDGVGRRRVARWWAALLNCEDAPARRPCGACGSCRRFGDEGGHPDHREVGPSLVTSTGRANRRPEILIGQLVPRPGGDPDPLSRWLERHPAHRVRVGVIDGAEALTAGAANAFLKMLEEPPPRAAIVLIAPSPRALLPTIASRAATIRLGAVPIADAGGPDGAMGHPAARLGRPGALERARADAGAWAGLQGAIDAWARALPRSLEEALEAADALEKSWSAARPDEAGDALRERLRALPPVVYAALSDRVAACEEAMAAYASAPVAVQALTLEARAILRRAGVREA